MIDKLKAHANWVATIVALLLGLVGVTVSVTNTTEPTPGGGTQHKVTVTVDKSGAPGTQAQKVTAPASVVNAVKPNLEANLKDETPTGAPADQVLANHQLAEGVKAVVPPLPEAGATAGVPGCRTQFVGNQSSRNGVRPIWFVLHYTVSPNVPGWGDVNAIVALFDRSSSQASSTFVLDAEGHCAYIVPIERKAWTQAAGNSLSVSVEIIATGRETALCTGPCLTQLRVIQQTVSARTGIPPRAGSVYPAVSGLVQHKDGGLAWGGHIDITPFSSRALISQVLAGAKPSKRVVWVRHRRQVHTRYVAQCRTKKQRGSATCAGLRSRARLLDTLLKRKGA